MEELNSKGKEFWGIGRKKPHKKTQYEFSTDPITGIRSNKGTYSGRLQKKWKQTSDESTETFEFSCSGTLSILLWYTFMPNISYFTSMACNLIKLQ